jgi:hypothetical protein
VLTVLLSRMRAGVATKTFAAHLHDIGHLLQILTAHPERFRYGSDDPSATSTALGRGSEVLDRQLVRQRGQIRFS